MKDNELVTSLWVMLVISTVLVAGAAIIYNSIPPEHRRNPDLSQIGYN